MSNSLFSLAFGVGSQNRQGAWLEVFYAQPLIDPSPRDKRQTRMPSSA